MKFKNIIPLLFLVTLQTVGGAQAIVPNITDPRLEVKLPNASGDSLSLASLKGKVVLVDFWASWCVPCRASNKRLVKIYPKYKAEGFEIFGISLDTEKKDWLKAIGKDKITWLQVNEKGDSWDAKTVVQWNITAIPTTFLVNKKGDVVAMNLEGGELEKAIQELLKE